MPRGEIQSFAHKRTQKRLHEFQLESITKKRQEEAENDILCFIVNKGACETSFCLYKKAV
jgi:hypothetical protein